MNRLAVASPTRAETSRHGSVAALAALLAGGSLVAGALAGELAASDRVAAVLALALVLVPVAVWKKPELGPAVLAGAALLVEQFDHFLGTGPAVSAATTKLPLFHGLGFLPLNPADLFLGLLLAIWVAKSGTGAVRSWPHSAATTAMLCVLGSVLLALVVGAAHGGDTKVAFMEARPYVYLGSSFLLASVLVMSRSAIRGVLWTFVAVVGLKAVQGLVVFLAFRGSAVRPDAVLGHEEALFFTLFLLLAVALWLFELRGTLRTTATVLAPVVLAADLANARRAAWLLLAAGLVTLAVVGAVALPHRRAFLVRTMLAVALVASVYIPAYWNRTGGFAQPARAVRSAVAPTARDEASDFYRMQEDANLIINIGEAGPLGKGFGVPIHYALPIVDLSDVNPFIAYVPHNGGFYVLMRMGVLGAIALWSLLAVAIVAGCRLARSADRELALLGAIVVCAVVSYTFMGHLDQGFFFYRIALVVGTLIGLTQAAGHLSDGGAPSASSLPGTVRS